MRIPAALWVLAVVSLHAQPQEGLASWYGAPFHGRRTASGEIFDMNQLTAAHRTLPFGTRVRVTLLSTGRSVEVRVNDRGPFVENRIIDISRAAAQQIGLLPLGVGRVRIEVLDTPTESEAPMVSPSPTRPFAPTQDARPVASTPSPNGAQPLSSSPLVQPVFIQLIALSHQDRALQFARDLLSQGIRPQIRREGNLWRVFLAVDETELPLWQSRLSQVGLRDWQVRRRPIPGETVAID